MSWLKESREKGASLRETDRKKIKIRSEKSEQPEVTEAQFTEMIRPILTALQPLLQDLMMEDMEQGKGFKPGKPRMGYSSFPDEDSISQSDLMPVYERRNSSQESVRAYYYEWELLKEIGEGDKERITINISPRVNFAEPSVISALNVGLRGKGAEIWDKIDTQSFTYNLDELKDTAKLQQDFKDALIRIFIQIGYFRLKYTETKWKA